MSCWEKYFENFISKFFKGMTLSSIFEYCLSQLSIYLIVVDNPLSMSVSPERVRVPRTCPCPLTDSVYVRGFLIAVFFNKFLHLGGVNV